MIIDTLHPIGSESNLIREAFWQVGLSVLIGPIQGEGRPGTTVKSSVCARAYDGTHRRVRGRDTGRRENGGYLCG